MEPLKTGCKLEKWWKIGHFSQFFALKCLLEAPKFGFGGSKRFVWLSPGAMNDRTTRNHFENM